MTRHDRKDADKAGLTPGTITLEADARHLMTDVWTSVGVVAGVALVSLTGWERLDPIIADKAVITNVTVDQTDAADGRITVRWTPPFDADPGDVA